MLELFQLNMDKIEHLGIAVKDLQTACETYTKLLGKPPYKTEAVESEGVNTMFFDESCNRTICICCL